MRALACVSVRTRAHEVMHHEGRANYVTSSCMITRTLLAPPFGGVTDLLVRPIVGWDRSIKI